MLPQPPKELGWQLLLLSHCIFLFFIAHPGPGIVVLALIPELWRQRLHSERICLNTTNKPKEFFQGLERWLNTQEHLFLQRTQFSFQYPCHHIGQLTTSCNSSSRRSDALFWLSQALHVHDAQTHKYKENKKVEDMCFPQHIQGSRFNPGDP